MFQMTVFLLLLLIVHRLTQLSNLRHTDCVDNCNESHGFLLIISVSRVYDGVCVCVCGHKIIINYK